MKIKFRQAGGIAGQIEGCELDSEALEPEEGRRLEMLVNQCGYRSSVALTSPQGRDLLTYTIEVESKAGRFTLAFDEMSLPKSCGALLEFLQERAQWRAPE